jgi:hypothetical protein
MGSKGRARDQTCGLDQGEFVGGKNKPQWKSIGVLLADFSNIF